ncbi:MAG: 23S rRNA (pseudouridine(1915)-N(3))-methyltransferase RlmH [Synergistaceae bacterium]|nr:23S rRNA (pseudouridine(1915)-N(3))-methyltransferase RlmH [Synergistaceae bacterium]
MKIIILSVGKTKDIHLSALAERYIKRTRSFLSIGQEFVPEAKDRDRSRKIEREGEELLKRVQSRDFIVTLGEDGEERDSPAFARWLGKLVDGTSGRILFIVGGAFGLSGRVCARRNASVSLSKMTLPHEFCPVLLAEQIYRSFTILRGGEYHH